MKSLYDLNFLLIQNFDRDHMTHTNINFYSAAFTMKISSSESLLWSKWFAGVVWFADVVLLETQEIGFEVLSRVLLV